MTVHTAPFHPDLEEALLAGLQAAHRSDPLHPVVVLVRSRLLGDYLRWLIAGRIGGCVNLHIVTFPQLLRDLTMLSFARDSRRTLPRDSEQAVVADIVSQLPEDGYYFSVKDRPGFHRVLQGAFHALDEAGIIELPESPPLRQSSPSRWRELVELHRAYRQKLSAFKKQSDRYDLAREAPEAFVEVYGTDRLVLYGIYDFTVLQWRLIETLTGSIQIDAFLPHIQRDDDWGSAFAFSSHALRRFTSIPEAMLETSSANAGGLGNRLFRYRPEPTPTVHDSAEQSLRIFAVPGTAEEIDGIVRRMNELALYEGVPFHRLGVLLWNPERYHAPLLDAFSKAGIPYCDTIGSRLSESQAGMVLLALLKLTPHRIRRRDLVDLISTQILNLCLNEKPGSSGDKTGRIEPDAPVWEEMSLQCGLIEGSREDWANALNKLEQRSIRKSEKTGKAGDRYCSIQAPLFRRFTDRLIALIESIPRSASPSKMADRVRAVAEELIPTSGDREKVLAGLASLSGLDAVIPEITFQQFFNSLENILQYSRIHNDRYVSDGVAVYDKLSGRGVSCDALFLPGLTQGAVPMRAVEDPVLPDAERRVLGRTFCGDELALPLAARRSDEEKLLFALALDSAKRIIYLSYSSWDETRGAENTPSRYLLEVCRIVTGEPVSAGQLTDLPFFDSTQEDELLQRRNIDPERYPLEWLQRKQNHNIQPTLTKALYTGRSPAFDHLLQAFEARRNRTALTAWDGVLSAATSLPSPEERTFRVTDLEAYAVCPFRYFMERELKLQPRDEPEMILDPPPNLIGSIVHEVLKKLMLEAKRKHNPLTLDDLPWALSRLPVLLKGEISSRKERMTTPNVTWDLAYMTIHSRLAAVLREFCSRSDGFLIEHHEVKLEREVSFYDGASEFRLNLSGRIDRVDRHPDSRGIRVIDYKTGKVDKQPPENFRGGRSLQLPIYLKAELERDPAATESASEAAYWQIDATGGLSVHTMPGETLTVRAVELGRLVRSIADGIATGLFPPTPHKDKCRKCPVSATCDHRSRHKFEHDNPDGRYESIKRMQAID